MHESKKTWLYTIKELRTNKINITITTQMSLKLLLARSLQERIEAAVGRLAARTHSASHILYLHIHLKANFLCVSNFCGNPKINVNVD